MSSLNNIENLKREYITDRQLNTINYMFVEEYF